MSLTERECKIQSRTMQNIRTQGGYVYKNAQGMFTEPGRPDVTSCIPVTVKRLLELYGEDAIVGLFVGIEIKRDGQLSNVSRAQSIVGNKIRSAGGIWIAVDNSDVVDALIARLTGDVK